MESGDHTHIGKFVLSSAEDPKQHAETGMMENLDKSEQLGFTDGQHVEQQSEDLLFGDSLRKDNKLPSKSDINQFILHEIGTNVNSEDVPANTNIAHSVEANKNEDLCVTERTRRDNSSNLDIGSNQHDLLLTGHEAGDSSNTNINSQTTTDLLNESTGTVIDKTDTEDFNSNGKSRIVNESVAMGYEDRLPNSRQCNVEKGETLGLGGQVESENENVKKNGKDSNNSFIYNEKSEIKTESEKISDAETHKRFSHEGDKSSNEKKQQNVLDDEHPDFAEIEKANLGEDIKDTQLRGVVENTQLGENREDCKLGTSDTYGNYGDQKVSELPASKERTEDEWLDILGSGHLKKKIIKKAEHDYRPQNLHICEINLEGCLEDGTVVEKFENLKLQVGDIEVIQGIDLALPLMNVGEVALLEVGQRFAYGSLGRSPDIPPNAKLMYTIELLSAENEPDLESLSIAQRKEIGDKKRERGNWWFARQEYSFAIQSYRRAIEFLDEAEGGFSIEKEISEDAEKHLQELLEDRLKVFNNLAAAQMKIKAYDAALTSVENVLRCQPQNVKALFRKGKILSAKGDTTGALSVLRNASQLEPDSKAIKQELQRLLDVIKHDTKQEKSLYQKMLGQKKRAEKTSSKGSKISYRTWGIVCSSVAVVLLGAVAYRYKFL